MYLAEVKWRISVNWVAICLGNSLRAIMCCAIMNLYWVMSENVGLVKFILTIQVPVSNIVAPNFADVLALWVTDCVRIVGEYRA